MEAFKNALGHMVYNVREEAGEYAAPTDGKAAALTRVQSAGFHKRVAARVLELTKGFHDGAEGLAESATLQRTSAVDGHPIEVSLAVHRNFADWNLQCEALGLGVITLADCGDESIEGLSSEEFAAQVIEFRDNSFERVWWMPAPELVDELRAEGMSQADAMFELEQRHLADVREFAAFGCFDVSLAITVFDADGGEIREDSLCQDFLVEGRDTVRSAVQHLVGLLHLDLDESDEVATGCGTGDTLADFVPLFRKLAAAEWDREADVEAVGPLCNQEDRHVEMHLELVGKLLVAAALNQMPGR